MGSVFMAISNISPVKWINSALFRVIYDNDYSQVAISMGINLGIAAVFICIAVVFSRRGNRKYA
jgi:ABC-2 type transport system permease protein